MWSFIVNTIVALLVLFSVNSFTGFGSSNLLRCNVYLLFCIHQKLP